MKAPEIEPAAVSRFDRDGRPVTAETLPHLFAPAGGLVGFGEADIGEPAI